MKSLFSFMVEIWIQFKRPFSYFVEYSPDNQVLVHKDASASLPSVATSVLSEMGSMLGGVTSNVAPGLIASSSSSSSSARTWKYDVFLSFRGLDTRKGITFDIYDRLNMRGINTFMDEQRLQVGAVISPTLLAAIKESRFAIVVLSQNYAYSAWCLEELREICLSMEDNRILPLFYHVDPTDVRYQKGSFQEAFSKHETSGRHESERVKQWKAALNKVCSISGWNTNDHKTHKELVDVIVEVLFSKLVPETIEFTGDFRAFEATRQAMDEVMKALEDDEVTVVGVYGMGGVGKTTLVEHVGAQAQKSGIFDYVTKGVVSQNLDLKKVQDALAEQLGIKLLENTELGRAARLRKEIKRREKILIIVDDIWERMDLSTIGIPSYTELQNCNSKVLLTTRIRNVCHAMECQRKITLNVLSEQDSWALFVRKARRSFESPTFERVAKKVAGECKGLPIALIAVARALGDKDMVEWKKAAHRLQMSQTANPDDYGEAFQCIKLSYDYLKDEDYKSCFLLCCLFPEDCVIRIEEVLWYAIGKGLFRDANTLEEARDKANSVATHLIHSCLLLESEFAGYVRMHDVVRDAAIQIAQSAHGYFVKARCDLLDWPRQLPEGCSAISSINSYIHKLPETLVCPKLQILLLNGSNFFVEEIPETFFQCLNELRVLDLSWTSFSSLPQSFSLLTNLQALHLDKCGLLNTSMLGKLKKLEILSMRNTSLKELPIEIGGLTNLRMLDITHGDIVKIPSKVISKLHKLEELYMQGFLEWGSKVEGEGGEETNNACFDEVTSLSKLRILKVCFSNEVCIPEYVEFIPNWVEFDIRIGTYDPDALGWEVMDRHGDRTICLELDIISCLPEWFCIEIMEIAERLEWNYGRRLVDIFVVSERGRLQGLKHLDIMGNKTNKLMNKKSWVPKKPVFENLEELHLCQLDCAELLALEFLPAGSLINLKSLEIHLCYNWGNILLPSTSLQNLPNLEELDCDSMNEIEYVFGYEELREPKETKLRKIRLCGLDTVRSINDGPVPPAVFQNLQSLSIRRCKFPGSLFTCDVAQCLFQLKSCDLQECPFLKRIVEASNKKIILPKLKQFSLKALPMLYYETFDIECPSLEQLELWDCPKFSPCFSDFLSENQVQLGRWTED